ncbi:uncharacterized protein [Centroberyx affinis]|uniref:uncharacterized protein n=1 Tax=Centroberyx affinis TaxID=166261 RepID=UPI003A5C5D29
MESTRTSLFLFLLLNQLSICPTFADQAGTDKSVFSTTEDTSLISAPIVKSDVITTNQTDPFDIPNNATGADCLIDTQMGLIAVASAGGLILCLLISTLVLACQVCYLQRRARAPRPSRSNMDLVSGTGYWGTDRPEVAGLVGPCDSSVMLEEVRADGEMEEKKGEAAIRQEGEKVEAGLEEGAKAMAFDPEEMAGHMQSSTSRDSCLDVPRDLEDMPLVV